MSRTPAKVPFLALTVFFLLGDLSDSVGAEKLPPRPAILEERPCGPDAICGPFRYLLFQGCAGADFRDACRHHDACYDTIDSDRKACDRRFLEEMLAECPKSKHPARARFRAHFAFLGVKLAGGGAWRSAQNLARKIAGIETSR